MPPKKNDGVSFAAAYEELQTVVADLERDGLNLDDSLAKYERGLELAAQLRKRLSEAENRVKEIRAKFSSEEGD